MPAPATYESADTRDQYLALHYPPADPALDPLRAILGPAAPPPDRRYPHAVRELWDPAPGRAALDVGCATGAVARLLGRDHARVVGLDRSRSLVEAAALVARAGRARYRVVVEGEIARDVEVEVKPQPNVAFMVGDALGLPFRDRAFATVLALNLVDRVPDPARALDELRRVTEVGGILVIASPYTWLEDFTPRARWLGGFVDAGGRTVSGPEAVRAALGDRVRLEREEKLPFFIPHHERSGQLGLSHVARFRRIS